MQPEEADAARLWDMLTHAREIVQTIGSLRFEDYLANRDLRLATERRIEIIGEAARNVSRVFQEARPEIPWQKIAAQRHVLAHEYGQVNHQIVFRVATVHVPELIAMLVPLVPPPPADSEG
jgi:uncharacterized protein with HEPN domain